MELLISHARLPREVRSGLLGGRAQLGGARVQSHSHCNGCTGCRCGRGRIWHALPEIIFFFSIKHYSQSTRGGLAPWAEPLLAQGGSGGPGTGMPQLAGAMSPSLSQHPVDPRPVLRARRKRSTGKKRGAKGAEGCRDAATRPVLPQGLGCHPQTRLPQALLGMPRSPPGITETVLEGGGDK